MKNAKTDLPKVLNCQTCAALVSVKWEKVELSKTECAYLGGSTCLRCCSDGVHVVADPAFLENYAKSMVLPDEVQLDIFGTDASGFPVQTRVPAK